MQGGPSRPANSGSQSSATSTTVGSGSGMQDSTIGLALTALARRPDPEAVCGSTGVPCKFDLSTLEASGTRRHTRLGKPLRTDFFTTLEVQSTLAATAAPQDTGDTSFRP